MNEIMKFEDIENVKFYTWSMMNKKKLALLRLSNDYFPCLFRQNGVSFVPYKDLPSKGIKSFFFPSFMEKYEKNI